MVCPGRGGGCKLCVLLLVLLRAVEVVQGQIMLTDKAMECYDRARDFASRNRHTTLEPAAVMLEMLSVGAPTFLTGKFQREHPATADESQHCCIGSQGLRESGDKECRGRPRSRRDETAARTAVRGLGQQIPQVEHRPTTTLETHE